MIIKADILKLDRVPIELDTRIIRSEILSLKGIPCKHEYWGWVGVHAETVTPPKIRP
jgi:hypothetical protein